MTSDRIGEIFSNEKPVSLEHSSLVATANERDTTEKEFYILQPKSNSRFRNKDVLREHSVELVAPHKYLKPGSKKRADSPLDKTPAPFKLTEAKKRENKTSEKAIQTAAPRNTGNPPGAPESPPGKLTPQPTAREYLDLMRKENSMLCNMIYAQNNMIRCISDDIDKANSRNKKLAAAVMNWLVSGKNKLGKGRSSISGASKPKKDAGPSLTKARISLRNPFEGRRETVPSRSIRQDRNCAANIERRHALLRSGLRSSSAAVQGGRPRVPQAGRANSHHDGCCRSYVNKRHPSFVEQEEPRPGVQALHRASKKPTGAQKNRESSPRKQGRRASSKQSSARKKVISALADIFAERISLGKP